MKIFIRLFFSVFPADLRFYRHCEEPRTKQFKDILFPDSVFCFVSRCLRQRPSSPRNDGNTFPSSLPFPRHCERSDVIQNLSNAKSGLKTKGGYVLGAGGLLTAMAVLILSSASTRAEFVASHFLLGLNGRRFATIGCSGIYRRLHT